MRPGEGPEQNVFTGWFSFRVYVTKRDLSQAARATVTASELIRDYMRVLSLPRSHHTRLYHLTSNHQHTQRMPREDRVPKASDRLCECRKCGPGMKSILPKSTWQGHQRYRDLDAADATKAEQLAKEKDGM